MGAPLRKSIKLVCYILSILLISIVISYAQEKPSFVFQPLSDQAFQTLLQFYQYDATIPFQAQITENKQDSLFRRERFQFQSVDGTPVFGFLAIPTIGKPPYPCILQLHGITGSKSNWWREGTKSYRLTQELLASGFAVLALDAQLHGERKTTNDFEDPRSIMQHRLVNTYREMVVHSVVDYRRSIDYLTTFTEIDTSRIGLIGYSLGGKMAFILSGIDSRIKVSVACVTPIIKSQLVVWGAHNFAHAIHQPFLMLMARSDEWYSVEDAQQLFDLIETPDKDLIFFDGGHNLPDGYIPKTVSWFQKHLEKH